MTQDQDPFQSPEHAGGTCRRRAFSQRSWSVLVAMAMALAAPVAGLRAATPSVVTVQGAHAPLAPLAPRAPLAAPGSAAPHGPTAGAGAPKKRKPAPLPQQVDINHAPLAQLMTLPGVDAALARKIVAHRPYRSKAELVTKQVLPTGPYLALKDHAMALQQPAPATATAALAVPAAAGPATSPVGSPQRAARPAQP